MKQHILVAEDDTVLREIYHKKFTLAGYEVTAVSNGEEALEFMKTKQPDLAILDIHMPKVDGLNLLEELPAESRRYPVIMLTNFGDSQSQRRGHELGVTEFLIKSEMTIKTLLATVERYLRPRA